MTKLNNKMVSDAYSTLITQKLIFMMNNQDDAARLTEFIKTKNERLYGKKNFRLLPTIYDANVIVGATPDLGPDELGLFAARDFKKDEIVCVYLGKDLWGTLPLKVLREKIASCTDSGDYFWEVMIDKNFGKAIDSCEEGSVARFVNDSLFRNLDLKIINGQLCYVTRQPVPFGQEFTAGYGGKFFNASKPRIAYHGQNLQTIFDTVLKHLGTDLINFSDINDLTSFNQALEAIAWQNLEVNHDINWIKSSKLIPLKHCDKSEERSNTSHKELYVDSQNNPMFFDLSKNEHVKIMSKEVGITFEKTSNHNLLVAPTGYFLEKKRLGLFTGRYIEKKEVVCSIIGEQLNQQQVSLKTDLDDIFLFQVNTKLFLYCKHYASEALFIQGVSHESLANVKLTINNGKPIYTATKNILPKSEIVAYFGNEYPYGVQPTTLEQVVSMCNQNQIEWDVILSHNQIKNAFTFKFYQHILTPGRDICFTSTAKKTDTLFIASTQEDKANVSLAVESSLWCPEKMWTPVQQSPIHENIYKRKLRLFDPFETDITDRMDVKKIKINHI